MKKQTTAARSSSNRKQRRKFINGIKIQGIKYPCPKKWVELDQRQKDDLQRLFFSPHPYMAFYMTALLILLKADRRPLLKIQLNSYVKPEELNAMLPLTHWLVTGEAIHHGDHRYRQRKPSFLQFIRLDDAVRQFSKDQANQELMDKCIAIAYLRDGQLFTDEDLKQRQKLFSALNPELKLPCLKSVLEAYQSIVDRWPTVFPKDSQKQTANGQKPVSQTMEWFKIKRMIAGDPLKMQEVANLDADAVFFDLTQRIHEKRAMEEKMEQMKKRR